MKRIVWIDVGTHYAQEYRSLFGSSFYFYSKLFARVLRGSFGIGPKLKLREIPKLIGNRYFLTRHRRFFYVISVEPNLFVTQRKKLQKIAELCVPVALTSGSHPAFSIERLWRHINGDIESAGTSILKGKSNNSSTLFVPVIGVNCQSFFEQLQPFLADEVGDYLVFLRINNEGLEDDVIYAAHNVFGETLGLVAGHLKDVKGQKGAAALDALEQYMKIQNIPYTDFYPAVSSWPRAFDLLKNLVSKVM